MNELSNNDPLFHDPSDKLIPFYLNETRNSAGLTIEDIWALDDDDLESSHEIVQWAFPTTKESAFNPDAPQLCEKSIRLWHTNPRLADNLRGSFDRYLSFFGLTYDDGKITQCEEKPVWDHFNHNWLRVTRILDSLNTLGLTTEANALFAWLQQRFANATGEAANSLSRWREVMKR